MNIKYTLLESEDTARRWCTYSFYKNVLRLLIAISILTIIQTSGNLELSQFFSKRRLFMAFNQPAGLWPSPIHTLSKEVCRNKTLFAAIRSSANDVNFRNEWRKTYGKLKDKYGFGAVFFIGRPENDLLQAIIEEEVKVYNDIHQSDFVDSYHNITIKTGALLEFYLEVCDPDVVLFKLDDDVYWNVSETIAWAQEFNKMSAGFAGALSPVSSKPDRNPLSRWYMPEHEYPYESYPQYCGGSTYLARWSSVDAIMKHAKDVKPIWIDDIYFCGLLREKANETLFELPFIYSKHAFLEGFLSKDRSKLPRFLHLTQKDNFNVFKLLHRSVF